MISLSGQTRSVLLNLILIGLVACQTNTNTVEPIATPTPEADILYIGLTDTATGLAPQINRSYTQETRRTVLQFVNGNNQALMADLQAGVLDAVLVHNIDADSQDWFTPVALDGLAIITHQSNLVKDLDLGQITAIFRGDVKNWSDVGGSDLRISLYVREPGSGAKAIFQERVLSGQRAAVIARIAPHDSAMRSFVAGDPGAIGYTMMGNLTGGTALSISNVAATPETMARQTYPLTVPLYFVAPLEPEGELRAILAWLQSSQGQAIVDDQYGSIR